MIMIDPQVYCVQSFWSIMCSSSRPIIGGMQSTARFTRMLSRRERYKDRLDKTWIVFYGALTVEERHHGSV